MMSDAPPSEPLKRLFLFLLAPSEKVFECIRLDVSSDLGPNASVGDILALAPLKSSEPTLVAQKLVGLCRMIEDVSEKHGDGSGSGTDVLTIREQRASDTIINGELLIAIPAGFTADHCQLLVERILKKQPKIRKLLQRPDPLAPRNARSSARRSSRSAHNSGGMTRSSSMSSMTGLALEAIEEGEKESKTSIVTSTRGDANTSFDRESMDKSTCNSFDDKHITTRAPSKTTDEYLNPYSNTIYPKVIEGDIARRKEAEDVASREIQATIRRDAENKLMEEKTKESIEARNNIKAKIENKVNVSTFDDANEQLLEPDNEDQHAADHIECLALQASELESSFISETSIVSESPDSPPKKRKLHRTAAKTKDENATLIAAFLPRTQHPADNSNAISAEEEIKASFRTQYKAMTRRIKQGKTSAKQKLQRRGSLVTAASAFVALSSALYHMWNPYPIGLSAYVVFIVVFVTSAALLQRRKLSIVRQRRRRSRSLSTTPIRKGSIRRIQVPKRASGTPLDPKS